LRVPGILRQAAFWAAVPAVNGGRSIIPWLFSPIARIPATPSTAVCGVARCPPARMGSAGPGGGADQAAEILRLERRVLVGEHVRIDRAKGGLGPVPHPIVEGLDDLLLEVARTRVSVDHGPALVVRELVIGDAHDVHLDAGRNEGDDGMHVRRDAGGRMQRNGGPYRSDIALGDVMASEEVTRCVGAVHLEPVVRARRVPGREAHVVEHGTGIEKLVIETQLAPPAGESAPVIDTTRMMEQQWRLCIPYELSYLAREFAVGSFERIDRRCHCIFSVTSSRQLGAQLCCRPDPPRAIAPLPKIADFCGIPLEIGDRAESGGETPVKASGVTENEYPVRRARHSSSYMAQVPANGRPPLARCAGKCHSL
jgi:hypothetical protein